MDSLSKEGEEPALILIPIVATLFFSLSDGGRPYKEEVNHNDNDNDNENENDNENDIDNDNENDNDNDNFVLFFF